MDYFRAGRLIDRAIQFMTRPIVLLLSGFTVFVVLVVFFIVGFTLLQDVTETNKTQNEVDVTLALRNKAQDEAENQNNIVARVAACKRDNAQDRTLVALLRRARAVVVYVPANCARYGKTGVVEYAKLSARAPRQKGDPPPPSTQPGTPGASGLTGPQGKPGIRGAQGPAGPKGDTGDRGPIGPAGERGADGARGPEGERGERGENGPQGPQGETGPQGPQGPEGPQGPQGPEGPAGASAP